VLVNFGPSMRFDFPNTPSGSAASCAVRWPSLLLVVCSFFVQCFPASSADNSSPGVACLGRIAPENGILFLAAPYSIQGPSIVEKLSVSEGERVSVNQIVAVTHYHDTLEAAYELEQSRVKVAEARLAQVKAGHKESEIAAQKAMLQRAQAELTNAEREFHRDEELYKAGTTSVGAFDRSRLVLENAQQTLEEAKERLKTIAEVRSVDVQLATAELDAAIASAQHAKAEFDQTNIRSPIDGQILKIHAWPGMLVGPAGVMELARTDSMFVHAEVYESDIARVKNGQRAEITGEALPGKITGRVEHIGFKVGRNDLQKVDPSAYTDSRVVEVKIKLDDNRSAARLINAQVSVRLLP
jgi:HlyD family secretion protein